MPYNYKQFRRDWGAPGQGGADISRQQFRQERTAAGGGNFYRATLPNRFTPVGGPGVGGPIPGTQPINWFADYAGGKKLNVKNFLGTMNTGFNTMYANQEQYRAQLNELLGGMQNNPAMLALRDPALMSKLTQPVISDQLLEQNVGRATDRVAMEGAGIDRDLAMRGAASGQGQGGMLPSMAGLKYMTAFKAAEMENQERNNAAITNAQGFQQGMQGLNTALASALGVSQQAIEALKAYAGNDMQFLNMLKEILGGKMALNGGRN